MTSRELEAKLTEILGKHYADIVVTVEGPSGNGDPPRVTFVTEAFRGLYLLQRYHKLLHLLPAGFAEGFLGDYRWIELAPGESQEDLEHPDERVVGEIAPNILRVLEGVGFFSELDEMLFPEDLSKPGRLCHGNFENAKKILNAKGFGPDEHFDVFHVLMARGGYCDCEILYNAVESSRLKANYWKAKAEGREVYDPHRGPAGE